MSTDDNIFVAADRSLEDFGRWLGETLELEAVRDADLEDGVLRFRASARTVEGDLYLTVEPNVYGEVDPAPEDVSAIDRYQCLIDVYYAGPKDEELQEREARLVFDDLARRQPEVAMILSHNMALMTAAYLPGAGVHTFPRGTTLDVDDIELWRPWVVA
ncbi:MAG TPA: hypothetical protein VIQ79_04235 [Kribbella sp.]|jgi:hypothetical protein